MWQTQLLNKWWRKVCMCMSVWFFFVFFFWGGGENFFKFLFTRCIRARSGRRHFCRRCRPVGSEQSGRPESRCRWSCRSSSRRPSLSWLDGTDPAERQTVFEFTLYTNTMIQTFKVRPILTPRWPELSQNCFWLFVSVYLSLKKELNIHSWKAAQRAKLDFHWNSCKSQHCWGLKEALIFCHAYKMQLSLLYTSHTLYCRWWVEYNQ